MLGSLLHGACLFVGGVTSRNTTTTTTRVIRFDNFIKHNGYIGCEV